MSAFDKLLIADCKHFEPLVFLVGFLAALTLLRASCKILGVIKPPASKAIIRRQRL
jgi:hypothetical protein